MKLTPVGDRILVQRFDNEEKITTGGIVLPTQAQKRSNTARVVAVSDEVKGFNKGDIVLISDTAGVPFSYDEENYLVLRVPEVLVRVRQ